MKNSQTGFKARSMPFGEDNNHVPVRLIDFENLENNSFVITNQFKIRHKETKIPDVVLLINGIPIVVGEAKTPIRPAVSWLDGAHEIRDIYENSVPQLFVPTILSFATEGRNFIMALYAVRYSSGLHGDLDQKMRCLFSN